MLNPLHSQELCWPCVSRLAAAQGRAELKAQELDVRVLSAGGRVLAIPAQALLRVSIGGAGCTPAGWLHSLKI